MKIYVFIVIRRYLCFSLLDLLDKKKRRQNLPLTFAMNLLKNLVHFFNTLSASYSGEWAFQTKILWFFFLSKWSKFIYWRFSLFSFNWELVVKAFKSFLKFITRELKTAHNFLMLDSKQLLMLMGRSKHWWLTNALHSKVSP